MDAQHKHEILEKWLASHGMKVELKARKKHRKGENERHRVVACAKQTKLAGAVKKTCEQVVMAGKWTSSKTEAYDSFLAELYDSYGSLDRLLTGDKHLSLAPSTFEEMELVNAVTGC